MAAKVILLKLNTKQFMHKLKQFTHKSVEFTHKLGVISLLIFEA